MSSSNGFFRASSSGDGLSRSFSETLMPRKSAILPTKVVAITQVLFGVAICYATFQYLHGSLATLGCIAGGGLLVLGIIGILASVFIESNLLASYLIGGLLVMIFGFFLVGQVHSEVQIDCTLTFLNYRLTMLHHRMQGHDREHVFDNILMRMEELYDYMDSVDKTKARIVEKENELKSTDLQLLSMKLKRLKDQAESTLSQSQNQVQAAKDWIQDNSDNEHVETIRPHIEVMEEKLSIVNEILEDIKKLEFMQDSLTDEDILYVEHALLNTLGSPLPSPSDDEEVFRQKSRATREDLKNIEKITHARHHNERESANAKWQSKFDSMFTKVEGPDGKVTYTSRGEDNYHPANIRKWMPKHCLQGEEARRVLDSAGLAVLVLQMISAYLAVSLLFSLPLAENIFA